MRQKYRVMVVDDEPIVRRAVAGQIPWAKHGIEVVTAANAMEALEQLKEQPVNLMLVDIRMPVMDGIALLKRVRESWSGIDFIILSGYAEFEYAQQAMRLGAKDYLLKPLDEASLLRAVLDCMASWEKQEFARNYSENQETKAAMPLPAQNHPGDGYSRTVTKILRIVEEETANEELSLKWISAKKMYLNENYLSKLFQKEVHQRFSAYLMERRMLLAMQLLREDQDALILDVARKTGFGDNSQYFSSAFKKYTGYTPSEYKKMIRQ